MVRTRAQERAEAASGLKTAKAEEGMAPDKLKAEKKHMQKTKERIAKHEIPEAEKENTAPAHGTLPDAVQKDIDQLIAEQGSLPLHDIGVDLPLTSNSGTILALLLEALLKAAPISHTKAEEALKKVVQHGYQDINVLKNTSWDKRGEVLIEGGYRHYWKKASTNLGDIAEWITDTYDGDLTNLYKETSGSRSEIRSALKQIKGIGDVAVDIFLSSVQSLWPEVAPFIPERSLATAQHIGIGTDVNALYKAVGKDPKQMCKLSRALTKIRLEKDEKEYMVHEEGAEQGEE